MPKLSTPEANNLREILGLGGGREAARQLGISPQSVSNMLSGKEMSPAIFDKILDYCAKLKERRQETLKKLSA